MKPYKNVVITRLAAFITLLGILYCPHAISMLSQHTPQQTRALAAKMALFKKSAPLWVQTQDNEITPLDTWQINYFPELKSLLNAQQDKNSKAHPLKASMLTKNELLALSTALNKIKQGEFDEYYQSIEPEYKKSLTDKNAAPGQLRTLITAAGKIKSSELTALLSSYFLPNDIQRYLMLPNILAPVIDYLKEQITSQDILYPTVLQGHPDEITNCEFSKNGAIVVTSSKGATDNLIIWDVQTGRKLKTISVPNGTVDIVKPSPDGSRVITFLKQKIDESKSEDAPNNTKETIVLWNTKTGNEIKKIDITENIVAEVQFSDDGSRVVVGAQSKEIIVENENQPEEKTFIYIVDGNTGNIINKHDIVNNYAQADIAPQGTTMVARSGENLILYDLITGTMIKQLDGTINKNSNIDYSADGTKITASNFTTETVFIWDGLTGEKITEFNNIPYNSALNSDGTTIATYEFTANNNYVINIWDVATHEKSKVLEATRNFTNLYDINFSPNNTMILAATDIGIIIWNTTTGTEIKTLLWPNQGYFEATFSSNSTRIQSHKSTEENQEKCTVIFWDVTTGRQIERFIELHDLLETTPDFLNIISPDPDNNHNFILWTSLNSEERAALKTIETKLDLHQAHALYQLYIAKKSHAHLLAENKQWAQLPANIQAIARRYLMNVPSLTQKVVMDPTFDTRQAFEQAESSSTVLSPEKKEAEITPPQPVPTKTWWQWFTGK